MLLCHFLLSIILQKSFKDIIYVIRCQLVNLWITLFLSVWGCLLTIAKLLSVPSVNTFPLEQKSFVKSVLDLIRAFPVFFMVVEIGSVSYIVFAFILRLCKYFIRKNKELFWTLNAAKYSDDIRNTFLEVVEQTTPISNSVSQITANLEIFCKRIGDVKNYSLFFLRIIRALDTVLLRELLDSIL